jgi:hypothetical protein
VCYCDAARLVAQQRNNSMAGLDSNDELNSRLNCFPERPSFLKFVIFSKVSTGARSIWTDCLVSRRSGHIYLAGLVISIACLEHSCWRCASQGSALKPNKSSLDILDSIVECKHRSQILRFLYCGRHCAVVAARCWTRYRSHDMSVSRVLPAISSELSNFLDPALR